MLPQTTITKSDGNTGVVKPSSTGVLAIIAPSASGTSNQAGTFARPKDAYAAKGLGPLVEYATYFMQTAKKPVLLIRATASTAAAYSALTFTGTGTSVITAGGTDPVDDYDVFIAFKTGGTIGVAGITYTISFDGGVTTSPVTALGTGSTAAFNVPVLNVASGVSIALAAGTIVAGDTVAFTTTSARMTNSDLVTALEALRVSRLPWDAVLVGNCLATSTTIATLDGWLAGLEGQGIYKNGYINTRHKNLPVPTAETEATFAGAMATLVSASSTIRVNVGTDGGDLGSPITGVTHARPVHLAAATRGMSYAIGVDPAFRGNGPIPGYSIADTNGNPRWHDEALFPGLDDLRLTTFRTFDDEAGVFITNSNILSPSGSDYVWDQHVRVMNAACTIAHAMLNKELSRGVRKQPPDKVTGKIYILEDDASAIDTIINEEIGKQLAGQVNGVAFVLSRTDDLSGNGPGTCTGSVEVDPLKYIKRFDITSKFVRSISVTPGGV